MKGGCAGKAFRNEFLIHGLWPTNTSKPYPKFCSNDAYHQMSSSLETQLHNDWPNLLRGTDEGFWENEFKKHGTCSLDKFSQEEYFELALKIRKNIDLLDLLNKATIVPNNLHGYLQADIVNAIKVGTKGFEVGIMCAIGSSNLQEVRVCLVADGSTYRDCPLAIRVVNCKQGAIISLPI
jgi:ribonuclease T2